MKKHYALIIGMVLCVIFGGIALAQTKDDINLHKSCNHCGMDRKTFDFSRTFIEYNDGTSTGACSLRCAAVDLANNIDKIPVSIKVGDFNGKQLIDADKAFWVIGGKKPGVMTRNGKWAFEKKEDAESFVQTNGGQLASFEETIKMAYEDMYADTKMIREKRKMKRMNITMDHTH